MQVEVVHAYRFDIKKAVISDICVSTKNIILQIINTRGINYVASTL